MIIKFNEENFNKLKGRGKLVKNVLVTSILGLSLIFSGCNKTMFDTKYGFDKALV